MTPQTIAALVATLLLAAPASAEDGKLTIEAQLRARGEALRGQFRPKAPEHDAALFLQTSITAAYDAGPIVVGGELLDARSYFQRRGSTVSDTEVNALEPLQGYVATDLDGPLALKAGRFTLNIGSRRLVARNNYRNSINGFTGVEATLGSARRGVTLFWTAVQTRRPDDAEGIRRNRVRLDRERGSPRFLGLFARAKALGGEIEAYGYRLAERDSPGVATADRRLWTLGARLVRDPAKGAWDHEVEAALQRGTTRASDDAADRRDLSVRAALVHADLGRTFASAWQPRVALAFDYASGDGGGRRYGRFDTLYGARVFEFGPTGLYGPIQRGNLVSVEARLETRPHERIDTLLAIRPLWLARRTDAFGATMVRDPEGRAGRHAGTQLEGRVRGWIVPERLRVGIGAAWLAKGRFLRRAANAPATGDSGVGFVELTFTP